MTHDSVAHEPGSDGLRRLLEEVGAGRLAVGDALESLKAWPSEDMSFARLDHHRALRKGFPEVVYCPGKTGAQVAAVLGRLADEHGVALATRADADQARAARHQVPDAVYHPSARCLVVDRRGEGEGSSGPGVTVVSAGTADAPVAEEAALTAGIIGSRVTRLDDVGVAGVHRLMSNLDALRQSSAVVVVAGMDGALPGVVAGLIAVPVIAVPTSVGYGASLGGIGPLLTMLCACAPGVAVVNIDNGFGAGYMAAQIDCGRPGEPTASSGEAPT